MSPVLQSLSCSVGRRLPQSVLQQQQQQQLPGCFTVHWFTACWERKALALAQDKAGRGGYAPKCVLGEDVANQMHWLCAMGGFPDPSWPIKPALQLSITGVCKVALWLVRIWLQEMMLALNSGKR